MELEFFKKNYGLMKVRLDIVAFQIISEKNHKYRKNLLP